MGMNELSWIGNDGTALSVRYIVLREILSNFPFNELPYSFNANIKQFPTSTATCKEVVTRNSLLFEKYLRNVAIIITERNRPLNLLCPIS
ncbi:hypothetical protein K1T71_009084 [Dendrolimus kikuchii]|uniref:Uncharacterized protein n=1 Tax=Dendrolimus kikuchii TaxID=765133 RepID=A0ACC1CTQ9_9NEOP|nr:hypothetical protein K1T71_009084 [Dendrolimus kikuchii]